MIATDACPYANIARSLRRALSNSGLDRASVNARTWSGRLRIFNSVPLDAAYWAVGARPCKTNCFPLSGGMTEEAEACGVSETTVRNWLTSSKIQRSADAECVCSEIAATELNPIVVRTERRTSRLGQRQKQRLTKERVSRVISLIGKEAGVIVRKSDGKSVARDKFASAHDLRRGCAMRLMNSGVSAETLKVVMRHADFATTEKHYGALRSAQAAADEVQRRLAALNPSFVGGLVGGKEETPQLSAEELLKLKSLLNLL